MEVIQEFLSLGNCPICSSKEIVSLGYFHYSKPTFFSSNEICIDKEMELCKCQNCLSRFVSNPISEKMAVELYTSGSSEARWVSARSQSFHSQAIFNLLSSRLTENIKLLDVGCGSGALLDFAKDKGVETYGVEYSESSCELLRKKEHTCFNSLDSVQGKFDIITAFDIVEHLYNIPHFLNQCYDLLSLSGALVIFSGDCQSWVSKLTNTKWWYIGFPEHIAFPSKKYFKSLKNFKVSTWISVVHPQNPLQLNVSTLKYSVRNIMKSTYRGIPCIYPDHFLTILKKS